MSQEILSERLRLRSGLSATLHALPVALGARVALHLLVHPLLSGTPFGTQVAGLLLSTPSAGLADLLCGPALFGAGFHGARTAARRGLDCRPGEVAANLGGGLMWAPLTAPPALGL
jgi:hypothetical protein